MMASFKHNNDSTDRSAASVRSKCGCSGVPEPYILNFGSCYSTLVGIVFLQGHYANTRNDPSKELKQYLQLYVKSLLTFFFFLIYLFTFLQFSR